MEISFKIHSDWQQAFNAQVEIHNRGSAPLTNWKLEFELPARIDSIWTAKIISQDGGKVVLGPEHWNQRIEPGGSVVLGFLASPGGLQNAPVFRFVSDESGVNSDSARALPSVSPNPQPARQASGESQKSVPPVQAQERADDDERKAPGKSAPTPTPQSTPSLGAVQKMEQGGEVSSQGGKPDYAEALRKSLLFYDAQRSGRLPEGFRIPWRGDSALQDGADVGLDLSGGFFDAGDHTKFSLPMLSTMTLLAWGGLEYRRGFELAGEWGPFLDMHRWGMEWILRAHPEPGVFVAQVGYPPADHAYWGPAEALRGNRPTYLIGRDRPGTEIAAEASAALAAGSLLWRELDPDFAAVLLRHARDLFDFADTARGTYVDAVPVARQYYNSFSGYHDELVWAAAWMYRATAERGYLDKAGRTFDEHLAGRSLRWTHSWDDKTYGALVLLAGLTGLEKYRQPAEKWLDYWTGKSAERIATTPGGLAWLDRWGSLRYAANTAFLAFVYGDTVRDPRGIYQSFARRQINYILGDNPAGRSYMVGFGKNPPRNPHHRSAHGSRSNSIHFPRNNEHVLYGALVGGPSLPNDFSYQDNRSDYVSNEVALDYNSGFTGALARMVAAEYFSSSKYFH